MSERGRLPELDRLWGLTQPVPTAPVPTAPVPTRPTVEPQATTAPVVEQSSWAPSIVPAAGTSSIVPAARTIVPAATATLMAPDSGVPAIVPAGTADGWVPARDADTSARDAADVAARRTSALAAASKAYADLHGHPLTHPRAGERRPRDAPRRWAVPMRLAVTAALALGLVGGAVALRSASVASAGLVPIELPPVGVSLASPAAGTDDAVGAASTDSASTDSASTGDAGPAFVPTISGGTVVVHVVGEVASPGVVELAAGSRVDDAISAAGGATARADLAALNLARVVIDGEQVVVPAPGDDRAPQAAAQLGGRTAADAVGSGGSASGTVDLNGADAAALDALPGIGPVLAGRIVDWRQANRRFTSIDQLGEVDGIGPTLLAKLRPLVRV
jgi:competence protein ComEA